MEQQIKSGISNKTIVIILVIAAALLALVTYMYFSNKKQMEGMVEQMTIEKTELTREFQNLALDYDSLQTNNDTINVLLTKERERISQLIEEIKTIKATNAAKIREYQKELTSLRSVMRNFVVQIDSLNSRNQELTAENKEVKNQMTRIKDSYQVLEKEKQTLAQKVEIASKLETRNIRVTGLNSKDKEVNKALRVQKIKVCFVVLKNITAPVGDKVVYLRIMRPDNALLMHSVDDVFTYEGSKINYSAKRTVEYGGKDVDVCIFYEAMEGELMAGFYTVDLFMDGQNVGTATFELK
jgi:predicted  nucleic acid-binding Zn-ribbon protein